MAVASRQGIKWAVSAVGVEQPARAALTSGAVGARGSSTGPGRIRASAAASRFRTAGRRELHRRRRGERQGPRGDRARRAARAAIAYEPLAVFHADLPRDFRRSTFAPSRSRMPSGRRRSTYVETGHGSAASAKPTIRERTRRRDDQRPHGAARRSPSCGIRAAPDQDRRRGRRGGRLPRRATDHRAARPIVVFQHGRGSADYYGRSPATSSAC